MTNVRRNSERGMALIVALMAMALMSALGMALMLMSQTETMISSNYRDNMEGEYAADAGIERVMDDVLTVPDWNTLLASGDEIQSSITSGFRDDSLSGTMPDGCASQNTAGAPTGPYAVKGCTLGDDVPQSIKDMQPYLDKPGASSLALEFLSPVKGPSLEQITVEVGSGIRKAKDGAVRYDEDVKKQAQQLGLAGW